MTIGFPRTHCGRGHRLTPDNVYTRPDGKRRQCRICKRAANRAWSNGEKITTPFTHCRRGHLLTAENSYPLSSGSRFCYICHKERQKRTYAEEGGRFLRHGITEKQYQTIVEAQGNVCPICLEHLNGNAVIDHDHQTGKVRGVLCTNCNTALGKFGDAPRVLNRALKYLEAV